MTGNVIFMDGWELALPNASLGIWDAILGSYTSLSYPNDLVRSGNRCLSYYKTNSATSGYLEKAFSQPYTHIVVGFGFYLQSSFSLSAANGTTTAGILAFLNRAGSAQVLLGIDPSTRLLRLNRGRNTAMIGAASTSIAYDGWNYIELRVFIHPTAGEAELRLNGSVEFNLTNLNTSPGADADVKMIQFGWPPVNSSYAGSGHYRFDDFVVLDASGGVVWPQGAAVAMMVPEADGAYSEWSSTGAAQYTEIDDNGVPDEDTTHLSTSTIGARTSVDLSSPPIVSGDVLGVQICANAKIVDPALGNLTPFARVAGVNYDLPSLPLLNSYTWVITPITKNPATDTAWTTESLNDLQIGWTATP